jgi:4-amino-4-deoxy-L-arabinose transferase-like glycosyltransferase
MAVTLRRAGPVILVIAAVVLAALPMLTYPLGRDQGEFATIGRGLLEGRAPYVDLWNPKPPAVFYVYAAAIAAFGRTVEALRAIDLLIVPLILLALYGLGARLRGRSTGLWAVLAFGVFYFSETFWTLTQNDGIALLPMTLAMLAALISARRPNGSAWWAFAAGLLTGWAVWFKYPFVLFAGAVALNDALWRRADGAGLRRGDMLAYLGGLLVAAAAGVGAMLSLGAWEALVESVLVTAPYTALGLTPEALAEAFGIALGTRWAHWGLLILLAAAYFFLRRSGGALARERAVFTLPVLIWLAAGTAIMLVQAKGYDYHWLPMLPPLALLAGAALDRLTALLTRRLRPMVGVMIAAGLLAALAAPIWSRALPYLSGQEDAVSYANRFQAGEVIAGESVAAADFLKARVAPGDSLYIWGFRPEVYYLSRLQPATRFIFQFPLVADWYPAAWREENVELLWAALPPYVLVLQVDYMPWVTGSEEDSHALLQQDTELNNWLMYNYERETQIGNFLVWRRISR